MKTFFTFLMLMAFGGNAVFAYTPDEMADLKRRAYRGEVDALIELAGCYERGDGVPLSRERALLCYLVAPGACYLATSKAEESVRERVIALGEERFLPECVEYEFSRQVSFCCSHNKCCRDIIQHTDYVELDASTVGERDYLSSFEILGGCCSDGLFSIFISVEGESISWRFTHKINPGAFGEEDAPPMRKERKRISVNDEEVSDWMIGNSIPEYCKLCTIKFKDGEIFDKKVALLLDEVAEKIKGKEEGVYIIGGGDDLSSDRVKAVKKYLNRRGCAKTIRTAIISSGVWDSECDIRKVEERFEAMCKNYRDSVVIIDHALKEKRERLRERLKDAVSKSLQADRIDEKVAVWFSQNAIPEEAKLCTIYFEADKFSLDKEACERLDAITDKTTGAGIYIVGYSDHFGSDEYSLALSDKRAEAVKKYLNQIGGAKTAQIQAMGEQFAVKTGTKEEVKKDRKVIIVDGTISAQRQSSEQSGCKKSSNFETYTVKKGDTLSIIARHHGVSVRALKSANNLSSDNVSIGQKLVIPGRQK